MVVTVPFSGWNSDFVVSGHPRNDISLSILHQNSTSFPAPLGVDTQIGPILSTGTKSIFFIQGTSTDIPPASRMDFSAYNSTTSVTTPLFAFSVSGGAALVETNSPVQPIFLVYAENQNTNDWLVYFSFAASALNNFILLLRPSYDVDISNYVVYSSYRFNSSTLAIPRNAPLLSYTDTKHC